MVTRYGIERGCAVERRNGDLVDYGEYAEAAAEIARLRAEVERLRGESAWQPIETAPRDGTWFIAFENGDQYPCEFVEDEGDGDGMLVRGGWMDLFNGSIEAPTHWRPLPHGPEESGDD